VAKKLWAAYFADPTFTIFWKTMHAPVSGDSATRPARTKTFNGSDGKTVNEKGRYVWVWRKHMDRTWKAIHDIWEMDSK
jgi:ketosteroid isomerase-like protein